MKRGAVSYLCGGNILHVDLTREEVASVPTDRYAPLYVGGRGIDARLLYESVGPATDPLSPENVVCLGAGPLSETLFLGSRRTDVSHPSRLSSATRTWAGTGLPNSKKAGWDSIVLHGKAEHTVYICIQNDRVEIRDLAGAGTLTEDAPRDPEECERPPSSILA